MYQYVYKDHIGALANEQSPLIVHLNVQRDGNEELDEGFDDLCLGWGRAPGELRMKSDVVEKQREHSCGPEKHRRDDYTKSCQNDVWDRPTLIPSIIVVVKFIICWNFWLLRCFVIWMRKTHILCANKHADEYYHKR